MKGEGRTVSKLPDLWAQRKLWAPSDLFGEKPSDDDDDDDSAAFETLDAAAEHFTSTVRFRKHAFVAVDEGQGTFAGRRRGEARVIGEGVGGTVQFTDVDDVRAGRAGQHRQVYALVAIGKGGGAGRGGGVGHLRPCVHADRVPPTGANRLGVAIRK